MNDESKPNLVFFPGRSQRPSQVIYHTEIQCKIKPLSEQADKIREFVKQEIRD